MKEEKLDRTIKKKEKKAEVVGTIKCQDKKCPFHGSLRARGREFKGTIIRLKPKRIAIEFERFIYIPKYERYMKKKTRIHAHLPDCLAEHVKIGSYVKVAECRPLSKIIHHVVTEVLKEAKK
ncbi:30S ribosomal protein S17 [Candidatus Pacearchaeota archaeon]|nr:30S ribosomal protein S17 [Candidatus Pacearchaeota archaeon]